MNGAHAADWLSLSDSDPPMGILSLLIGRWLRELTLDPLMVFIHQVQGFPRGQHSHRRQGVIWRESKMSLKTEYKVVPVSILGAMCTLHLNHPRGIHTYSTVHTHHTLGVHIPTFIIKI